MATVRYDNNTPGPSRANDEESGNGVRFPLFATLNHNSRKRRPKDPILSSAESVMAKKCKGCSGSRNLVKRAGPYLLGPRLGNSPVRSIVQCLARKEGTDEFYSIKLLTLENGKSRESQDVRQGKMLLHTEYSLLSLLHDQEGVVHHHGIFQDDVIDDVPVAADSSCHGKANLGNVRATEAAYAEPKTRKRLCLVLDCLCAHDYSNTTADLINLQHYVIREKKLSEREAVVMFHNIVKVVESLHSKNIVHRDLKLGNIVLNRRLLVAWKEILLSTIHLTVQYIEDFQSSISDYRMASKCKADQSVFSWPDDEPQLLTPC